MYCVLLTACYCLLLATAYCLLLRTAYCLLLLATAYCLLLRTAYCSFFPPVFLFVNFLHFFTNIHKTSKISSQQPYTPHHTIPTLTISLPHAISCPWSGLNPTGASQVRTVGTIPFRYQCWPRQARCHHGAQLDHTMPIGATTVRYPTTPKPVPGVGHAHEGGIPFLLYY